MQSVLCTWHVTQMLARNIHCVMQNKWESGLSEGVAEKPAVLVVDDNPLIVNVVKSLLASQDYQVFTCANGSEAIKILSEKNVDVIVCDVMMPEMDGYQLQEAVREKTDLAHIPFVFLTALGEQDEKLKGHESGADEYLTKPFEPSDLLSVVKGKILRSTYLKNIAEQKCESYRKKVIHTLSHEFRTPLVAINTGTELLIDQQERLDEQKIANLLEAIRRGGQRLEKLVNDFMLLQQIEAGISQRMFDNHSNTLHVTEVVKTIVNSESDDRPRNQCNISLVDHCEGVVLRIYEPHVQDIMNRLLSNAAKFSPNEKNIEVVLYVQEKEVHIEVRDRGIGFDIAKIKEAIDVFGQIDRERLEQQGGGLGLAIANRYAVINRGRLDFDSRPGGGSTVSLILPVMQRSSDLAK